MASITRSHFLRSSRIWPAWVPEALVETERQSFVSQAQPAAHQNPSFHFSACLQTIFSFQDSILGVHNPGHFQHARAFSQQSVARRQTISLLPEPAVAIATTVRLEHTAPRPVRANTAPPTMQRARNDKYEAMRSRILSVL